MVHGNEIKKGKSKIIFKNLIITQCQNKNKNDFCIRCNHRIKDDRMENSINGSRYRHNLR